MHLDVYKQLELNFPKPYKLVILSAIFIELEKKIRNFPRKNKFKQEYKLSREILENQERLNLLRGLMGNERLRKLHKK